MRRLICTLSACLLLSPAPARADIDAHQKSSYELVVVLDIAKHRLLTDIFRQQVQRELDEGLRSALGKIADVKVVDSSKVNELKLPGMPRMEEIRQKGLEDGLNSWLALTNKKTHFIFIDYVAGQYEIQARQHDGYTSLLSPVVRRERTPDRPFVARLAALLIDRDFGPIGTIQAGANQAAVKMTFRASSLGVPMDRWVQKGDVFLVTPMTAEARAVKAPPDTIVQVTDAPAKGECSGRFYDRTGKLLARKDIRGFRCLHIQTTSGPLRARVVQIGAGDPVANQRLVVRRFSFDAEAGQLQGTTDNHGLYSSEKHQEAGRFDRLAFVAIMNEQRKEMHIPVPIVDDRPATIKIPSPNQDKRTLLQIDKELFDRQAYETGFAQQELFRELKEMEAKPDQRKNAKKRAEDGLAESKEAHKQLADDKADLVKRFKDAGVNLDTSYGDQWLKFLETGHGKLDTYIREQQDLLNKENDPRRLDYLSLVRQGKLEEERLEFEKALNLYTKALGFGFDDPNLKKHFDQLTAQWQTKGGQHESARTFIFETWPGLDLLKRPDAVDEAQKHFLECQRVGDILGPRKLLQGIIDHVGKLKKLQGSLDDVNEEDRKTLEQIANLSASLARLGTAVEKYVAGK